MFCAFFFRAIRAGVMSAGFAAAIMPLQLRADGVLTVGYKAFPGAAQAFSQEDLDVLRQVVVTTTTPWTTDTVTFSGPPLSEVLALAGVTAETFQLLALNDYVAEISLGEIGPDYPIVATRINGKIISVRDKGPYWIIFPYDQTPSFRTEVALSQSVWQLVAIQAE